MGYKKTQCSFFISNRANALFFIKLLLFNFFSVSYVFADPLPAEVEGCKSIRSSVQRLACFDDMFHTPPYILFIEGKSDKQVAQNSYPIVDLIRQVESTRPVDNYDLLLHAEMEHAETAQQQVVLTAPAIGSIGIHPVFSLSCIHNISRLQIILPEPLLATRVKIALQDQQGKELVSGQWRVIDGGYIADSGRGLPTIRMAKKLKHSKRIKVSSDQAMLDGLVFDLEKLPQYLLKLGTACHWFG